VGSALRSSIAPALDLRACNEISIGTDGSWAGKTFKAPLLMSCSIRLIGSQLKPSPRMQSSLREVVNAASQTYSGLN